MISNVLIKNNNIHLMFPCFMLILFLALVYHSSLIKLQIQMMVYEENCDDIKQSSYLNQITYYLPTITIYVGTSELQAFNLGISLFSLEIIIEGHNNKNSYQFHSQFNPENSITFYDLDQDIPLILDNNSYKGKICNDIISHFPYNNSVLSHQGLYFILLTKSSSYYFIQKKTFDGYIGLQLTNKSYNYSYISYLFQQELIPNTNFAFSFTKEGGTITIGEDYNNYLPCNTTTVNNNSLACLVNHIIIGNYTRFLYIKERVQFDLLKSLIYVPYDSGLFIYDIIIKISKGNCWQIQEKNNYLLLCNETVNVTLFPNIYLEMFETKLILYWANIFEFTEKNHYWISKLIFKKSLTNIWKIGIPGLIDNNIAYDNDNNIIRIENRNFIVVKRNENTNFMIKIFVVLDICLLIGIFLILIDIKRL